MGKLDGQVAVITGAGSGIGQATAVLFAQEGAQICAASRTLAHAEETAQLVAKVGGHALAVQVDVSRRAEVETLADQVIHTFGQIDILCNSAAIGHSGSILECSEEEWDAVMAVNVTGVFFSCAAFLPHMLARGQGNIINIASIVGLVGLPKRAAYSASKGAVIALTRQLAVEYVRQKIRVNCICPGTVDSPWVARLLSREADPETARQGLVSRQPLGRLGTPDEIAHAALYLASPEAAFATGTVLVIDGGLTAA